MKHVFVFILALSLLCSASCKSQQTKAAPKMGEPEETTLTGSLENKRGVMDALSCFCYNCGYVTTSKGERIAVCIADENITIDCKRVLLKGKYVTVKKEKDPNGVCSGGTMTYFEASLVSCY